MALVGRRRELREIQAAVGDALSGRGRMVLLTGEPGIGKTALAHEAADAALLCGFRVAWATCWESEKGSAYWPWVQLFRRLEDAGAMAPGTLAGMLEGHEPAGPHRGEADHAGNRLAFFDEVASRLVAATASSPIACIIDDLQWSGVASALLLRYVAQQARTGRLLLVATARDTALDLDGDLAHLLGDLRRDGIAITLRGLSRSDVAELLDADGGQPDERIADDVFRRSGGNPLFVRELGRLLDTDRMDGDDPGSSSVPEGIRAVLARRLELLPADARAALDVCAVVGESFDAGTAAAVAGLEPGDLLERLDPAVGAQLIRTEAGERLRFAHALVREVAYGSIRLDRRAELHGAVGRHLSDGTAEDASRWAEVANHLMLAPQSRRDGAALALRAARRAIELTDYEEAVALARRALDTRIEDIACDALLVLGEALAATSHVEESRESFVRAASVARRENRPDAMARAALGVGAGAAGFEVHLFDDTQIELLREALQRLGPQDSALRAWVLARLSVALSLSERDVVRRDLAVEAVAIARRIADPGALAYALAAHCDAMAGPDYPTVRLQESTEIVAIAERLGSRPMELLGRRLRLVALLELGRLAEVDDEIDAFARTADAVRQPLFTWYVPLWRGMRALMRGDFEGCARFAEEAERLGVAAQSTNASILVPLQRAYLAIDTGDSETGYEIVRTFIDEPATGPTVLASAAGLAARGGLLDEARRLLAETPAAPDGTRPALDEVPRDAEWLPAIACIGDAAVRLGETALAERVLRMLEPYVSLYVVEGIGAVCLGPATHVAGLLAAATGRPDEARRWLENALASCASDGSRLIEDQVRHDLSDRTGGATVVQSEAATGPDEAAFVLEGAVWTLAWRGRTVRLPDAKGLHDLARLIAWPGREVHVLDLAGSTLVPSRTPDELADAETREALRRRLRDLEEEIEDAQALGDVARGERAAAERDTIMQSLASVYGIGGRTRMVSDEAERARKAVTRRIRLSIQRIAKVHTQLGAHLESAVQTGLYCRYAPSEPVAWRV